MSDPSATLVLATASDGSTTDGGHDRTDPGTHSSVPDAAESARSSVFDKYGRAHDPMCPWPDCGVDEPCPGYEDCYHDCQCDLIAEVRADERARMIAAELTRLGQEMRTPTTCAHTKYVGCPPCEHDVIDEPTTCARGCRDGLVRVLSASGDDTEVDLCPCQR